MGQVLGANCSCCSERSSGDIKVPNPNSKANKALMTQNKLTAHNAKAFLVTCMDFRLFNDTNKHLKSKGYDVNYDQFVLAGVSLGFLQKTYPSWGKALLDHIGISIKLHHISKIILLDHMDCGAYKTFRPGIKSKEEEYEEHKKNLVLASEELKKSFPNLIVRTWILHLDGKLDCIKNKQ